MVWQKMAMDLQQKLLAVQENVFAWRQEQAERDEKFAMRIQALEQIRHNETIDVAEKEASGTNWQAIWTLGAFITGVLALIVSAIVTWFTIFRPAG